MDGIKPLLVKCVSPVLQSVNERVSKQYLIIIIGLKHQQPLYHCMPEQKNNIIFIVLFMNIKLKVKHGDGNIQVWGCFCSSADYASSDIIPHTALHWALFKECSVQ